MPRSFLLAAALLTSAVSAQPSADRLGVQRVRPPHHQGAPDDRLGQRSAGGALLRSAGATAAGIALGLGVYELDAGRGGLSDAGPVLIAATLVAAPSAGNVWLGEMGDATAGAGLRAVGAGALLYAASNYSVESGPLEPGVEGAALVGVALYVAGLSYDLVTQVRNGSSGGAAGRLRVRPAGAGAALAIRL